MIDRSKISRAKIKVRQDLQNAPTSYEQNKVQGVYFDGRHDKTLVKEKRGAKYYQTTLVEDHYSLVQEPGSQYLGHTTPDSGSALSVSESILSFISTKSPEILESLQVLGSDGTVVNTGMKNGVIRRIELKVGRPLQWVICLLHLNELPLRHLFESIDGPTSGPTSYTGPIGKQIQTCETLSIVRFAKIDTEIPDIDIAVLSKDQQYMLQIVHTIKSGVFPPDLSNRDPGSLNLSRWLTTGNRILRLYVSNAKPSANLKISYISSFANPVICLKSTYKYLILSLREMHFLHLQKIFFSACSQMKGQRSENLLSGK